MYVLLCVCREAKSCQIFHRKIKLCGDSASKAALTTAAAPSAAVDFDVNYPWNFFVYTRKCSHYIRNEQKSEKCVIQLNHIQNYAMYQEFSGLLCIQTVLTDGGGDDEEAERT